MLDSWDMGGGVFCRGGEDGISAGISISLNFRGESTTLRTGCCAGASKAGASASIVSSSSLRSP